LSKLDRGIQSPTEMFPLNRGRGVAQSFNCTPAFVYVRLADALVLTFRVLQILVHLYTRRTTMTYDYLLTYLLTYSWRRNDALCIWYEKTETRTP